MDIGNLGAHSALEEMNSRLSALLNNQHQGMVLFWRHLYATSGLGKDWILWDQSVPDVSKGISTNKRAGVYEYRVHSRVGHSEATFHLGD